MSRWPGLGERIRQRLLDLGYVQGDGKPDIMRFCDERRYRSTYFYKWANYNVTPDASNLERLASDLGVTPELLVFGPIIFERNKPLATAPSRRSGRGARPTLTALSPSGRSRPTGRTHPRQRRDDARTPRDISYTLAA